MSKLRLAQDAKDSIQVLWEKMRECSIVVSDRRYKQMVRVMAAESWLMGSDSITAESLMVGCNILWDTTDQIRVVAQIVRECINPYTSQAEDILKAAQEAIGEVGDYTNADEMLQIVRQIQEMANVVSGLPRGEVVDRVRRELTSMSQQMVNKMIGNASQPSIAIIDASIDTTSDGTNYCAFCPHLITDHNLYGCVHYACTCRVLH